MGLIGHNRIDCVKEDFRQQGTSPPLCSCSSFPTVGSKNGIVCVQLIVINHRLSSLFHSEINIHDELAEHEGENDCIDMARCAYKFQRSCAV